MKKQLTAYMIALMAATGCGSLAQLASAPQAFDDGIYTKPQTQAALAATSQEEMDALVRETLSSEVYVLSAQGDTIVVPKGKSARLSSGPDGGTDIAVFDTPDYWWNYSWSFLGIWAAGTARGIPLHGPSGTLGSGIPGTTATDSTLIVLIITGTMAGGIRGIMMRGTMIPGTGRTIASGITDLADGAPGGMVVRSIRAVVRRGGMGFRSGTRCRAVPVR